MKNVNVIKRPLITEKNTIHNAAGIYVFEVTKEASKNDIKFAVEKSFKVKVATVRTMNSRGHRKQTKHALTKAPYWKKALVTLKAGEKIALFEGV
jgi:large subunit ribosomal protein L23